MRPAAPNDDGVQAPPRHPGRLTAAGVLLTLCAGSALDLATVTTLRLTDSAPSAAVMAFRFLDEWSSPAALGASVIAFAAWLRGSERGFLRIFDAALWLSVLALMVNLVGLVACLFDKQDNPGWLLLSAALVYLENVAVFTAFYWRYDHRHQLDAIGRRGYHPGLLFPHTTLDYSSLKDWLPGYVDYLFLAFNTSSTFGPTLPVPLRSSIQIGMMIQVTVAMAVLVMLAARAIGMIG